MWSRNWWLNRAAKATFVFKDGHQRAAYEKALPDLEKFYASIREISTTDFDANRAARLEIEWWIVHRERQNYRAGDLANALAETASAVYNLPKEVFIEHGNLRAEAMNIRDTKAEAGGVTEEEWRKIASCCTNPGVPCTTPLITNKI